MASKYCKNYCQEQELKEKYHVMKSLGRFSHDYRFQSHKRCSVCEVFMIFDGILCPCCRNRFRIHPRNKKKYPWLEQETTNIEEALFNFKAVPS